MTKIEREARARVKEATTALAAYDAETDKQRAAEAAARKKLDRAKQPAVYLRSDGQTVDLTDMSRIKPGYIGHEVNVDLATSIETGAVKLETDGSVQRAAKTVAKALRVMAPADAAKLRSLDARLAKLRDERAELIRSSHERGSSLTVTELAKHAAAMHTLHKAIPYHGYGSRGGPDDYNRRRVESDLTDATIHLRFVTGQMDDQQTECPCLACRKAKNAAEEQKKRDEYIASLPIQTVYCKLCDRRHRAPFTHGNATVENVGRVNDAPLAWCAKNRRWIYLQELHEQEQAKAKAEHAKAVVRDGVTWTCVNDSCGEKVTALPDQQDDGEWYVECPVCEWAAHLIDIKPIGKNARRWIDIAKEDAA